MCQGQEFAIWGMVIPPLIGNPYNGYINPYYWVDDYPLHGNNGSLEPITHEIFSTYPPRYDRQFYDRRTLRNATKTPVVLPHGNLISQIAQTTHKNNISLGAISVGNSLNQTESFGDGLGRLIKCPANPPKACWGHWGWEKNTGTHSGSWRLRKDAY